MIGIKLLFHVLNYRCRGQAVLAPCKGYLSGNWVEWWICNLSLCNMNTKLTTCCIWPRLRTHGICVHCEECKENKLLTFYAFSSGSSFSDMFFYYLRDRKRITHKRQVVNSSRVMNLKVLEHLFNKNTLCSWKILDWISINIWPPLMMCNFSYISFNI